MTDNKRTQRLLTLILICLVLLLLSTYWDWITGAIRYVDISVQGFLCGLNAPPEVPGEDVGDYCAELILGR